MATSDQEQDHGSAFGIQNCCHPFFCTAALTFRSRTLTSVAFWGLPPAARPSLPIVSGPLGPPSSLTAALSMGTGLRFSLRLMPSPSERAHVLESSVILQPLNLFSTSSSCDHLAGRATAWRTEVFCFQLILRPAPSSSLAEWRPRLVVSMCFKF